MLLIPWVPFVGVSAMAVDSGPSFGAYLFITCVFTYPVTVFLAFILRQKVPMIGFLPCSNFVILICYGILQNFHVVK
jgi:hypothetical protein